MPKQRKWWVQYALKKRGTPAQNRKQVGKVLILVAIATFFIFLFNFAFIVGTDKRFGQDLSDGAQHVYQTELTVQAKRGTIYDRTGTPIAEDSTTYTVYAIIDKNYVSATKEKLYVQASQFSQVASTLSQHLGMDAAYVVEQLNQPELSQVYFGTKGKNISYQTMTTIESELKAAGVKGIAFSTSPGRMYPNGNFASTFIGLAQLKDNPDGSQSLYGSMGLEHSLDAILSGQDGKIVYEKDSRGRIVPGTETVRKEKIDGQDVYTTLSADLQRSLETNMTVFYDQAKSLHASATLVSAKTGDILATSQRPTFDADTKEGLTEDMLSRILFYQENYEPGSTMKVLTLASAIDAGIFDANAYYTNNGYKISDAEINDWTVNSGQAATTLTFAQGFSLSSNVAMTILQQTMGDERWLNYLDKFRFGYPTRFGMAYEEAGSLPADNIVTIAMSSFGQGISVTQAQLLRGFSAVANRGVMLEPKIISALYNPNDQKARVARKEEMGKPISSEAAQATLGYMVDVGIDPIYGTLYSQSAHTPIIQVDGYNVAVKSGTAQIPKENGSGYMEGELNHVYSVVAMIPAEDPEYIMYVTVQQPQEWNSLFYQMVVNPVLKEAMLLRNSLNLDSPAPSLQMVDQNGTYTLPTILGKKPGETAQLLRQHVVQPVILGNGAEITKASAKKGDNLAANQQVLLLTSNFKEVPDMYGWTKENLDLFSEWTGIQLTYKSSGSRAISQSVNLGTALDKTKEITITLGD